MENFIPLATAAKNLGCAPSFLRKKCADGSIPALLVGTEYRVQWSDVLTWARHKPSQPTSAPKLGQRDDLLTALDGWLGYLTTVRALSPNTIDLYRTLMRSYLRRMATVGEPALRVEDLFSRKTVMAVFAKIPPRSFNTKNNTHIALMSFGRFLIEEARIQPACLEDLKALKPRRQVEPRRTSLKPEDVPRLFDVVLSRGNPPAENVTLAAMLACMVYGGLRVSEVCGLRTADVDLAARVLTVRHGKGGKDRRIGITNALHHHLEDYQALGLRGTHHFLRLDGRPFDRDMLAKRMQVVSQRLGKDITCHGLRRTMATIAAAQGRSINAIRIALGHSDLTTTQAYLRTAEADVVREMASW